ncbi:AAA family ATPase [Streptomyces sp. NBC_01498]|uniref:HelD family protein n=1 Tax=Streptomyces sp. NBC_01498 TaxID=2975870 RepID=UPI002E7B0684|nr:ATP-binding domain-containing protein [Streptomyces sp. NBC_01498]WTL24563.1 AAA family ATPase [Streptomyces sp. NBC_01498]
MSTEELQNEQQFVTLLHERLDALREEAEAAVRASAGQVGTGRQAMVERDVRVAEHTGSVSTLNAVESGLCFGRIDLKDGATHHIGRIGIRQDDIERTPLLIDWRAPVARPFYLATGHSTMGLRRRRHLTTEGRRVTALHDEIMDLGDTTRTGHEDPDGDAVLLAALDSARTGRMADIVRTIQAEQDRIIRAPHRGILVVEGGPGTGKTAVALHRAAYLLYAHREQLARRAVLIVGPNPAFLAYIGEVLPSLGETGVLLATPGELFPGVRATATDTPAAAAVKGRARMADALAAALRDRQRVPDPHIEIAHDDGTLYLDRAMAEDARARARDAGLPHNLARPHFAFSVIDSLTEQLTERLGADPYGGPNLLDAADIAQLGKAIATSPAVHAAIDELWPTLTPQRFLTDYLAEPTHLPDGDGELIRRPAGGGDPRWTDADVPLLDEAAELLGEDDAAARAAAEAERREQIEYAQGVLELSYGSRTYEFEDKDEEDAEVLLAHDLIDAERLADRQEETDTRSAAERAAADRTWAFGHIVVDEAQELSAMAWRLLMRRCPARSMTLVGDPAQTGDAAGCDSWRQILRPYVGERWEHTRLGVNYRTPAEIMAVAAEVRRLADPAFQPPRSVRSTGTGPWVREAKPDDMVRTAAASAVEHAASYAAEHGGGGRLAVIAPGPLLPALAAELPDASWGVAPDLTRPVVLLDPRQAKGLEFDTVIVVDPEAVLDGSPRGINDLYVALTRATQRLGIVRNVTVPPRLAYESATTGAIGG